MTMQDMTGRRVFTVLGGWPTTNHNRCTVKEGSMKRTRKRGLLTAIAVVALLAATVAAPTVASAQDDGTSEAVSIINIDSTAGEGCDDFPELCTATAEGELVPAVGGLWQLNLIVPAGCQEPLPVFIYENGSAFGSSNDKVSSDAMTGYCYALAGVNDSAHSVCKFPCQAWDVNSAIRWLRANADGWVRPDDHTVNESRPAGEAFSYHLDPNRFAVAGFSSGAWTAAFQGTTNGASFVEDIQGRAPYAVDLEGTLGPWEGIYSSDVQAAIPLHAPTDFSLMDPPHSKTGPPSIIIHNGATSPESSLVGCTVGTSRPDNVNYGYDPLCEAKVQSANPIHYISHDDPPQMIFHGSGDNVVPHSQSIFLYEAMRDACLDVQFYSMDGQWHLPIYRGLEPGLPHIRFGSENCGLEQISHGPPDIHACVAVPPVCPHDAATNTGIAAFLDRVLRETDPPDLSVDASGNPATAGEVLANGSIAVTVQTDEASWYDVVALVDGTEVGMASVDIYEWGSGYPLSTPAPYATTIQVPIADADALAPGAEVTVQVTARDRVANEITLSDTFTVE